MSDQPSHSSQKASEPVAGLDLYLEEGRKDFTAADFVIDALVRLDISSFDDLVKFSGKLDAIAAVKSLQGACHAIRQGRDHRGRFQEEASCAEGIQALGCREIRAMIHL